MGKGKSQNGIKNYGLRLAIIQFLRSFISLIITMLFGAFVILYIISI